MFFSPLFKEEEYRFQKCSRLMYALCWGGIASTRNFNLEPVTFELFNDTNERWLAQAVTAFAFGVIDVHLDRKICPISLSVTFWFRHCYRHPFFTCRHATWSIALLTSAKTTKVVQKEPEAKYTKTCDNYYFPFVLQKYLILIVAFGYWEKIHLTYIMTLAVVLRLELYQALFLYY